MSSIPGIVEANCTPAQTARVAGTGIEVFAVYRTYVELGRRWEPLREAFHWLTEAQLRAALAYAEAHPEAMAERLQTDVRAEEQLQELWQRHPRTKPNHD
jgi:uncharacterized protein (DUF433 family)